MKRITIGYRPIAAAVSAGAAFLVFVALGGAGLMQSSVSLAQYQYGKKVVICHKGKKTITVSVNAWPAHERHGDTKGPCPADEQANKKGKKAKDKGLKATESAEQASGEKGKKPKPKKGTKNSSSSSSDPRAKAGKAKKENGRHAEPNGVSDQTGNGKPGKSKKSKGSGKPEKSESASPPSSMSNDSAPPEGGKGKGNGKGNGQGRGK